SPKKNEQQNFVEWGAAMKKITILALLLMLLSSLSLAQTTIPTCNSFDATGLVPIYSTAVPPTTTGTTLCTDYFGPANYANSPLPVASVDISPTGFTIWDG